MPKISTVKARDEFSAVLNTAAYGKERVILTRRGKPLVAIVPIEDLEKLEAYEDQLDAEAIREAWAEQGSEEPEPWEAVKDRLGLK